MKRNKLFALIICLGIVVSLSIIPISVVANGNDNIVSIEDVTLPYGDAKAVPIKLLNSTGVGGGQITLTFNHSVVNVTNVVAGDFDNNFMPDYSNVSDGILRITCMKLGEDLTGDLVIATVTLEAVGTSGSCELGLSAELTGRAGNAVQPSIENGTFNVEAPSECYIATATYGTPLDENINVLRDFRDEVLMTNPIGEAFVSTYYVTSPPIADALRENDELRTVTRLTLITPLVYLSKFALNGILLVFILGLAVVPLLRKDRMKILKSLLVGAGSILVFIATIFLLGFIGYTIPFCAVVGAYMLPFVIPLSAVFTLGTLLRTDINVSDNINRHAGDSKM